MVSKVLTAQEGPSGQKGAKEPEEGRMTRRASSRQKVTKHSTGEQGIPRKPLSSRRVNRRRSSDQESSNGQEDADRQEGAGQQGVHHMAMRAPE